MCLVDLPTTSGDAGLCPGLRLLSETSDDGFEQLLELLASTSRLESWPWNTSATDGRTFTLCSDCGVEVELEILRDWASLGSETMDTPASNGLVTSWTWPPTPPSTS